MVEQKNPLGLPILKLDSGPLGPEVNNTERAFKIAQAGTGKMQTGPTPTRSNPLEASVKRQTQAQLNQVGQQQQVAATQFNQAQKIAEREKENAELDISLQEQQVRESFLQRAEEILQDANQQRGQLDLNKQRAQMEQVGFAMRLGDEKYINNLKNEGRKSRLNNRIAFEEALRRSIWEDERELLDNDLSFRSMVGRQDRDFKREMTEKGMSWEQAVQLANMKAAQQQAVFTSGTQAVQSGLSAYGQYQAEQRSDNQRYNTYKDTQEGKGKPILSKQDWLKRDQGE